ncbi:T9SS type A sorting domain-containing protein [Flavobacteriaceae bacterium]|nr:T9SS type A sorting domain-containing protein [Flavobacteriaceae bacterium]
MRPIKINFSLHRNFKIALSIFSILLLQTEVFAGNCESENTNTEIGIFSTDISKSIKSKNGDKKEIREVANISPLLVDVVYKKTEDSYVHELRLDEDFPSDDLYSINKPISSFKALSKINSAAKTSDASNITLADIASIQHFSHRLAQENLMIYQDIISNAAGFASASEIISALSQKIIISSGDINKNDASISLIFKTLYPTSDFDESDIVISNGTLTDFVSLSSSLYTAKLHASSEGQVSVAVEADTFTDLEGNKNVKSSQFIRSFGDMTASTATRGKITISPASSFTVYNGANIEGDIDISDGGIFTMNGAGTISGDVAITDSGSLIATDGAIDGTVTYLRTLPLTNWYLMSSPVSGQDIDAFVSTSDLATGSEDPNNLGFSNYSSNTGVWSYYQAGTSGSGSFTTGQGHAVKLNASGSVSFSGSFHDADVNLSLTKGTLNGYNLIGNPFLASVSVNELLGANVAALSEETIWLWDQAADSYVEKNLTEDIEIAPSQGFFVHYNGTGGNFSITEAMQSHSSDTFLKSTTRPEIALKLGNGKEEKTAEIFFLEGATTGWDNGYDSSIFGGIANDFAIYTHAVANGTGRDLGIQSLPINDYENMVIPLGINAKEGMVIDISAKKMNMPEGITIYLEDREQESFTSLENSANFTTTLSEDSKGVGRFYLHTKTKLFADEQEIISTYDLTLYDPSSQSLSILGINQGKIAKARIYDILGNEVVNTEFYGNGTNDIVLPNLAIGVYIVHLTTDTETLIEKIIIKSSNLE